MSQLLGLFSKLQVKIEAAQYAFAKIGLLDNNGNIITKAPGRPDNYIIVRMLTGQDAGTTPAVRNRGVAPVYDTIIRVRRDPVNGNEWISYDVDPKFELANPTSSPANVTFHRHYIDSGLDDPVELRRLIPCRVWSSGGLTVNIDPFPYQWNGVNYFFPGIINLDVSSHVPGSGLQRFIVIGVDPATNTATIIDGPTYSSASMPLYANLLAISTGGIITSGGIALVNSQTIILEANIYDMRPLLSAVGSGVVTGFAVTAPIVNTGTSTAPIISLSTPLAATYGGTGAATLTAHALVVGNGTSAVNALAPNTARNVAISDGADWTSRALVVADLPPGVVASPLTTKGDVWTFDTVNQRLGIGANNTVLVADSSQATGNKWSSTLAGLALTAPTIGDFTNATHNHQNNAGGGTLTTAAIASGTFANSFINWAAPGTLGSTTPNTVAATNVTITGGGYIRPSLDSTSALLITKSDGATAAVTIDTTNSFLGIGGTPSFPLDVVNSGSDIAKVSTSGANTPVFYLYRLNSSANTATNADIGQLCFSTYFNSTSNPAGQKVARIRAFYLGAGTDRTGGLALGTWNSGSVKDVIYIDNAARVSISGATTGTSVVFGTNTKLQVGTNNTTDNNAVTQISSASASVKVLVIQTASSPSANAFEIQSSDGTIRHSVSSTFVKTIAAIDAGTNAVLNALVVGHNTSGTPVANYGTGVLLTAQDNNTANTNIARWRAFWNAAVHTSQAATVVLSAYGTAEQDAITIKTTSGGTIPLIGFGTVSSPTAYLHLPAGTTAASGAPLKFNSGTSMTSAEAGAVEFTTDDLFFTITTGTARKRVLFADPSGGLTSGRVPYNTTNGRLTDTSGFTFDGTKLTVSSLASLTTYNGDTLAGTGLGEIVASLNLTGQSAAIASSDFSPSFTPPVDGMYAAYIYLADTTASTSGGNVQANITYTDDNGTQTQSTAIIVLNVTGFTSSVLTFFAKTTAHIKYSTTVAGGVIIGSPQYALRIIVMRLS